MVKIKIQTWINLSFGLSNNFFIIWFSHYKIRMARKWLEWLWIKNNGQIFLLLSYNTLKCCSEWNKKWLLTLIYIFFILFIYKIRTKKRNSIFNFYLFVRYYIIFNFYFIQKLVLNLSHYYIYIDNFTQSFESVFLFTASCCHCYCSIWFSILFYFYESFLMFV